MRPPTDMAGGRAVRSSVARNVFVVLVWPVVLALIGFARGYDGGPHFWFPLAWAGFMIGLFLGMLHLVFLLAIRRARERRATLRGGS